MRKITLLFIVLLLASCGPKYPRPKIPALKVSIKIRDFVARDRAGQLVRLGQFVVIGDKIPSEPKDVLLSFYGTYCKPCQKEIYALIDYQLAHKDKLQVIVVALPSEDLNQVIKESTKGREIPFPILVDTYDKIQKKIFGERESTPLPFLIYINQAGQIEAVIPGFSKLGLETTLKKIHKFIKINKQAGS